MFIASPRVALERHDLSTFFRARWCPGREKKFRAPRSVSEQHLASVVTSAGHVERHALPTHERRYPQSHSLPLTRAWGLEIQPELGSDGSRWPEEMCRLGHFPT